MLCVGLRVSEDEGAPPAPAEQMPFLPHLQILANLLHILDESLRRVVLQLARGSALPTSSLVEQNDSIFGGVESSRVLMIRSSSRSSVHDCDGRFSV